MFWAYYQLQCQENFHQMKSLKWLSQKQLPSSSEGEGAEVGERAGLGLG